MNDDLPIILDRAAVTPLATQVADAFRAAATDGQLRAGDKLPSSRRLADTLGVSRTVTSAAYDQLHAEGWITGKHGAGTFITTAPKPSPAHDVSYELPVGDEGLIDLAPGAPCVATIDKAAWRRAWRAAADHPSMIRPQRAGLPDYRAAVVEHLLRHRGLAAGVDSGTVLTTAGTSSATGELAEAVLQPGDAVAMEEPGYRRSVGALRAAGMTVVPVPVDAEGLCVDAIPQGVRAVYCTPAHQFPMGGRLPAARRVELVDRARRDGIIVIEDDYDGELRYDAAPLPLLASIGPDVVVHLGTTSKILTSALGVGWMVAPAAVAHAVLEHRDRTGTRPSPAGQLVVRELATSGDLARHLRRTRREVSERREFLVEQCTAAGLSVVGDDAGAHVVVLLPSAEAERAVVAAGRAAGIHLDGLKRHHFGPQSTFGIALGYTACSRAELHDSIPKVAALLAQFVPCPGTPT
ncbi:PLP-dependent aminotransferase family protein [Antrihabitans sp. NCIMB 15449]|uniref:PLP-dependent aminotransferase family protein n=1 Tax=Antrihabitans spumae TaxID=3373370 RepID=A0ABW7JIN5_9NOCA